MFNLMGKFKLKDWELLDYADNPDDCDKILKEYKADFGSSWLFKWVEVEKTEKIEKPVNQEVMA